jgi:thiol-disulfide isomerase/thioredoxin
MKKLLLLLLFVASGAFAQADVVKFSAKIKHPNSDSLTIRSRKFTKTIVGKKGKFEAEFAITEPGIYQLFDGSEYAVLYLKNGFDLTMKLDAKKFDESITFKGKGAKENNLLAKKMLANDQLMDVMATSSSVEEINQKLEPILKKTTDALADKELDEQFRTMITKDLEDEKKQLAQMAASSIEANKMKGKPSPEFTYENAKGGTTSLADLKGKYVYVDVWATWCGPCRQQIPYLKQVEEKYHGKNIEFVSISIDALKDHDKWKAMVEKEQLGGIQLMAENAWNSAFTQAYGINSIPRFLLIDPKGNVVESDAKRPSDPKLQEQLDKLLK